MMTRDVIRYFLEKPFVRYVIAGGVAALVDFVAYMLVYLSAGSWLSGKSIPEVEKVLYANVVGTLLGFLVGFYIQRVWAFKSEGAAGIQLVCVALLLGFNIVIGAFLISFLNGYMHASFSKLIMQIVIVFWNFWIYKKIVFKR